MNTECDICCKTDIIIPCGANSNCKAMVCHDCRYNNCIDYFTTKCYYCFGMDYRQGLSVELVVDIFDCNKDYEADKPYILALIEYNNGGDMVEEFWEENSYCFPCE